MEFFTKLINNSFYKRVYDYISIREKFYKVKITSVPENAKIFINDEEKYFDAFKNGDLINYKVILEGYKDAEGSITVNNDNILLNINLEILDIEEV